MTGLVIRRVRPWSYAGLNVWAVQDGEGRQVFPRQGQAETRGACERWLDPPDSRRPADDDRAGGRNTATRRAPGDRAAPS